MPKKSQNPTKRSRDPQKTRAHILDVAFMEIFRNGFQGVSVDHIVAATDLTKGAFFHHFATKQELGYAIVDEKIRDLVEQRWLKPLEKYPDPLKGIATNLKEIIDETPEAGLGLGCPLNNLVQEMSPIDSKFHDKLKAVLEYWIDGVERHLKRAKEDGYMRKDVNTRHVAEFVVMNHEGAFGMIKSFRDRKLFLSLHACLKKYLETLRA